MTNLFDYLKWRGDLSFEADSFNQIDALLFAQISYIDFSDLLSNKILNAITIEELAESFKAHKDFEKRKNIGAMINPQTVDLFLAAAACPRFKNMKVYKYESIYDEKKAEQFGAITFGTGKNVYIAFRGTDDTFVGWKEDFNILCVDEIPSRIDAIRYVKEVAQDFPGFITILGHSKGGYLAMDSAARCGAAIQKRLKAVYNFDGPGFSKEYLASPEFKGIEPILKSYYPHFSIVGMIFNHNENYEIVNSKEFAINQHDPLAWQIEGKEFEHTQEFSEESVYFSDAVNRWVSRLDQNQREKMISAFFEVVEASGCKTNNELEANKFIASGKMIQAFAGLDRDTKKEVHLIVKVLKQSLKAGIPLLNAFDLKIQDIKEAIDNIADTITGIQK